MLQMSRCFSISGYSTRIAPAALLPGQLQAHSGTENNTYIVNPRHKHHFHQLSSQGYIYTHKHTLLNTPPTSRWKNHNPKKPSATIDPWISAYLLESLPRNRKWSLGIHQLSRVTTIIEFYEAT